MKIAIYSPYLDTLGGGERYMITIAESLSLEHEVEVLLDKHLDSIRGDYLKNELSKRFDLNLSKVKFVKAPIGKGASSLSRTFFLKRYDVFFYLTDGSIFFPTAGKNFLHIQSPLVGQPAKSAWGKFKLKGWDKILYNSRFTKEYSESNWPLASKIVYPPVDTSRIKPLKKEKYILSVGRFFGYLKDKKHEILIKTFKELFESGSIEGWSLHLAGSAGTGDEDYLESLKDLARDVPVKFYPNLEYDKLIELYGKSGIYWHASGFGETDPTKMEHFGISTVEAMAGGVVPVVIGKGGQREIVVDKKSGYLWQNLEELKQLTIKLTKDSNLKEKTAKEAMKRAQDFSKEKFVEEIVNLIK